MGRGPRAGERGLEGDVKGIKTCCVHAPTPHDECNHCINPKLILIKLKLKNNGFPEQWEEVRAIFYIVKKPQSKWKIKNMQIYFKLYPESSESPFSVRLKQKDSLNLEFPSSVE